MVSCGIKRCPPTPFDINRLHHIAALSRQRSRVRVSSSPPYFQSLTKDPRKNLGPFGSNKLPKHSLRNTSPRIIWGPVLQHPLLNERRFGHRQQTLGQDCLHQLPLSQTLALRCCLKILVRHMQIAVPQVVADGELMFSHLGQHRTDGVSESMPTHTYDADQGKGWLDLLPENRCKV